MRGRPKLRRWLRARLQRRLFVWFGATIVTTALVVGLVGRLLEGESGPTERANWRAFAAAEFADVWDDKDERQAFAGRIAAELDFGVLVMDTRTGEQEVFGGSCRWTFLRFDVTRNGTALGKVEMCRTRSEAQPLRGVAILVTMLLVFWGAMGLLARRIARPLHQVAEVAKKIGDGDLGARVQLGRHAHGEEGQLAERVNDMAERIQKQLVDQRELLAAVSHELRTPLGHMRILLEMARDADPKDRPALEETLLEFEAEISEMDALAAELLASARLDFAAIERTELDPIALARRALERAGHPEALLHVEGDPAVVFGDATLLLRAMANLLDNAQGHGGGVERLLVAIDAEQVRIEAWDRGSGFADAETAERVFEPFHRDDAGASPDAGRRGGLGLGLSLVRRIAEAHAGRAYADNRDGGGARVGFELPRPH